MEIDIISDEKNEIIFNILNGDHHTIGNLLQYYLENDPNVISFGFKQEHPLKDISLFSLKTKNNAKQVLKNAIEKIIKDIDSLKIK